MITYWLFSKWFNTLSMNETQLTDLKSACRTVAYKFTYIKWHNNDYDVKIKIHGITYQCNSHNYIIYLLCQYFCLHFLIIERVHWYSSIEYNFKESSIQDVTNFNHFWLTFQLQWLIDLTYISEQYHCITQTFLISNLFS